MEPSKNTTRRWIAIGITAAIAWVVFLATSSQLRNIDGLRPPVLEPPGISRTLDFAWSLQDLDGKPVDFAAYRGKAILLNIWATWCEPCLKEMPAIRNLAADPRLKNQGVAILCVSIDESPETLRQFMQDRDWKMTILRAKSLPPEFQTEGIPATFVISPGGLVVAAEVGAAKWDDPSVVDYLIKLARSQK